MPWEPAGQGVRAVSVMDPTWHISPLRGRKVAHRPRCKQPTQTCNSASPDAFLSSFLESRLWAITEPVHHHLTKLL